MKKLLEELGISQKCSGCYSGRWSAITDKSNNFLSSISPIDASEIGKISTSTDSDYESVIDAAQSTFHTWRQFPGPKRGEVIREIGHELRRLKEPLGELVSREMGKIRSEGLGEVQEAIDIADFAVGLSRTIGGSTLFSERVDHRMYEQWHPLGPIGVITAFNFPVAVWAWNAMIAAVCGDTVIWKPSEITPLTAAAVISICSKVAEKHGFPGLFTLLTGDGADLGKKLTADKRIPLISATGSCAMGRSVAETVGKRLGKSLLELGGNNAAILLQDAELEIALPSILFGAVGTAGQRCTSTRRLFIEKPIFEMVCKRLTKAYGDVRIGDPLEDSTLLGPLVHSDAVANYLKAIERVPKEGGEILFGGKLVPNMPSTFYVEPTLVRGKKGMQLMEEETFAPILYAVSVDSLHEAVELQNSVPQGLSSSLFTSSMRSSELFLSSRGSDCGIANINAGTSGAEIGGAFGGEKETGGGREAGSDSWKAYMRRQTNTINWSTGVELAQGVRFS